VPKGFFLVIIEPFFGIKGSLELSKEPYEPFFLRVHYLGYSINRVNTTKPSILRTLNYTFNQKIQ